MSEWKQNLEFHERVFGALGIIIASIGAWFGVSPGHMLTLGCAYLAFAFIKRAITSPRPTPKGD